MSSTYLCIGGPLDNQQATVADGMTSLGVVEVPPPGIRCIQEGRPQHQDGSRITYYFLRDSRRFGAVLMHESLLAKTAKTAEDLP